MRACRALQFDAKTIDPMKVRPVERLKAMTKNNGAGGKDWQIITEVRSFLLSVSEGMTPEKALELSDSILAEAQKAGVDVDALDIPSDAIGRAMFLLNLQRQTKTAASGVALTSKNVTVCFAIPNESICKSGQIAEIEDAVTELLFFYDDNQDLRQTVARSVWRNVDGHVERAAYEFTPEEAMRLENHFQVKEILASKVNMKITTAKTENSTMRM